MPVKPMSGPTSPTYGNVGSNGGAATQTKAATMVPIARVIIPGEPRVKWFRTLEEAHRDQIDGMLRTMEFLNKAHTYVNHKNR